MDMGRSARPVSAAEIDQRREPLYEQVASTLRQEILTGVYPVGSQLPVEKDLTQRFSVSRHTIREALRQLRDDNLIVSNKKAGTIILPHQPAQTNFLHAVSVNDLITFSRRWYFTIDTMAMERLSPAIVAMASLPADQEWLAIQCVAQLKESGLPDCSLTHYVHPDYRGVADAITDGQIPILPVIEDMFDISVTEIEHDICATVTSERVADRIGANVGEPSINVRRIHSLADGRIVLIADEIYPTSRFSYRFIVHREA